MTEHIADANLPAGNQNTSNRLAWTLGIALILFFTWKAGPALSYWSNIFQQADLDREDNVLARLLMFLMAHGKQALGILSGLLLFSAVTGARQNEGCVFLIVMAGLGWFTGRAFDKALAAQASCQAKAGWLNFCSLDAPMFSVMLLSVIIALFCLGECLRVLANLSSN